MKMAEESLGGVTNPAPTKKKKNNIKRPKILGNRGPTGKSE